MVECYALAHSHFDGDMSSRWVDAGWQWSGRGIGECMVELWRWCGGVVGSMWCCGGGDVVCECGCEFHMGLDVLLFRLLFMCIATSHMPVKGGCEACYLDVIWSEKTACVSS